jgi:hypothetical protein
LAFHPYPQVIPHVFNHGGFGPPRGLTPASTCPWIDHSASGLQHATERPVQTRFRSGSPSLVNLATHRNSQAHSSKGTPSRPCPEGHDDALTDCKPTVSGTISLPSRGTFHHSLTVLFTIGHLDMLSLRRWSSWIHADFHGPGVTRDDYRRSMSFVYGALTHCGAPFLNASTRHRLCNSVTDLVLCL